MNIRINAKELQHHGVVFNKSKHFQVFGVKSQYFEERFYTQMCSFMLKDVLAVPVAPLDLDRTVHPSSLLMFALGGADLKKEYGGEDSNFGHLDRR